MRQVHRPDARGRAKPAHDSQVAALGAQASKRHQHAREAAVPSRRRAWPSASHLRCCGGAHQLNDWRTCGTSTVCERRASSAASPSAAGACARELQKRSIRQHAPERRARATAASAPRSRGAAARHSTQLGRRLSAAAGRSWRGARRGAARAARGLAARHDTPQTRSAAGVPAQLAFYIPERGTRRFRRSTWSEWVARDSETPRGGRGAGTPWRRVVRQRGGHTRLAPVLVAASSRRRGLGALSAEACVGLDSRRSAAWRSQRCKRATRTRRASRVSRRRGGSRLAGGDLAGGAAAAIKRSLVWHAAPPCAGHVQLRRRSGGCGAQRVLAARHQEEEEQQEGAGRRAHRSGAAWGSGTLTRPSPRAAGRGGQAGRILQEVCQEGR